MKAFILLTIAVLLWGEGAMAQERGIGVTPANIEIGENAEWPYTAVMTVTNLSSETENFEVIFEKDGGTIVSAAPGRFPLDAGANTRVLVVFEKPRGAAEGLVKVVSIRTSAEGFTTGTGVKIPFYIEVQGDNTRFLAGVNEVFGGFLGFHQLFGVGMILATLILLWYVSDIVRSWIPLEVPKEQGFSQRTTKEVNKRNF